MRLHKNWIIMSELDKFDLIYDNGQIQQEHLHLYNYDLLYNILTSKFKYSIRKIIFK